MVHTRDADGVPRVAFAGDPPKLAKIIVIFPPGSDLFGEEIIPTPERTVCSLPLEMLVHPTYIS
jgi:hypothetical protein